MDLNEKLRKIEALINGAKTEGELQAALLAKGRILEKIPSNPIEYSVKLPNTWHKKLFVVLCAKHNLRAYRYARQRYTTSMVRITQPFMDQVLWPEYKKYSRILEELTSEIMEEVIAKIHKTDEEELVIAGELPTK